MLALLAVFFEVAVRSPEGGRGPDRDGEPATRCSITAGEEFRSPRMVRWVKVQWT